MNNKRHTQEPWVLGCRHEVIGEHDQLNHGYMIADCQGPEKQENAKRIISCVNACAGVDNETLLKIASGEMDGSEIVELAKLKDKYAEIEKQRNELLAAILEARSVIRSINRGGQNAILIEDEIVYWQRKEWCDWAHIEVLPFVDTAIANIKAGAL